MAQAEPHFSRIRALDGDQAYGFEEFCAHLARRDDRVPAGSEFTRLQGAGGDGGVECFWTLPDDAKWGWQSKFVDTLDKQQLTESVKTALKIHPELERYVICLPFDLTGPTSRRGKDQRTRWDEYVEEWGALAKAANINVQFERWTKIELLDRLLAIDSSGGRLRFWFEIERFGVDWFRDRLSDAAADAGPRYHPELNVEVPISHALETFGRTPRWRRERTRALRELGDSTRRMERRAAERSTGEATSRMKCAVDALRDADEQVGIFVQGRGDLGIAREAVNEAARTVGDASAALRSELEEGHGKGAAGSAQFRQWHAEYMVSFPAEDYDRCEDLLSQIGRMREMLFDPAERAAAERTLLVTGVAGAGKTHAICDAGTQRLRDGLLSVVILGEKLAAGDVADQIRQILGMPGDMGREQMLAALDAAAEATRAPLLLFIDALNERVPRAAWKTDLASFVQQVTRYDSLRLCMSCRTTYLDAVLPEELDLPEVEHQGFSGVEFEACFAFFAHWKLEPPSVPLLQPEYANPLFLRMVCAGLARADRPPLSEGPLSLAEVVDLVISSAELAAAERLDIDERQQLARAALSVVVDEMIATRSLRMSWERADELVNALLPGRKRSESLLEFLLKEGLLTEVRTLGAEGERYEVRFGFERLAEYIYVSRVLGDDPLARLDTLFAEDAALHLAGDQCGAADLQGLAEALAILVPERVGLELLELKSPLPRRAALVAVVNSLAWRDPTSFSGETEKLMLEALNRPEIFERALEQVLALAARSKHPLGANFLHGLMSSRPQADRDAVMCQFLYLSWERDGGARRLSEWAIRQDLGRVSRGGGLDWAQTLLWLCLAADRRVRDQATLGVVALMQQHPRALPELVDRMAGVDDDYVAERLYLAVYGVLIRAPDDEATADCATAIWQAVFAKGPPLNALIRDNARSIIELAAERNVLPDGVNVERCRPPYGSTLPEELRAEAREDDVDLTGREKNELVNEPGQEGAADPDEKEASLTEGLEEDPDELDREEAEGDEGDEEEDRGSAWRRIRFSVTDDDFERYTMQPVLRSTRRPGLGLKAAQKWILAEIGRMDFTAERFDHYDGVMMYRYGPGRGRPVWAERIGKKYQWVALYRLTGLVEDNIDLTADHYFDEPEPPEGTPPALQAPGERSLDPTVLVRAKRTARTTSWWSPLTEDFKPNLTNAEWLDDLTFPDSEKLLEVESPDGQRWLVLQSYPHWDTRGGDDYDEPHRDAWMQIRGYLVPSVQADKLWNWLRRQDLHGRWMPEAPHWLMYLFSGEYPWSVQAQRQLCGEYVEPLDEKVPVPILPVGIDDTVSYELDAYHSDPISLVRPTRAFFEGAALQWDRLGGYTAEGRSIFSMPDFEKPGPEALLVDRDWIERWLTEHKMELVWTVLSEKHFISGLFPGRHDLGYAVHSRAHRLIEGEIKSSAGKSNRFDPSSPDDQ